MLIKDDCPSADVASQTNYDFQQLTPQTAIHCHGALKGRNVAVSNGSDYVVQADALFAGLEGAAASAV